MIMPIARPRETHDPRNVNRKGAGYTTIKGGKERKKKSQQKQHQTYTGSTVSSNILITRSTSCRFSAFGMCLRKGRMSAVFLRSHW